MEIEFKGKKFNVLQGITHPAYSFATFLEEEHDFRNKYWNVKEGDVVIDVGSSYGSYSLTACAMGATVFSFEPEITVYDDLVKNVKLNNWESRCIVSNMAMWSYPCTVDMKSYAPHWPQQCISGKYSANTLDNLVSIREIKKIDWLKVDVEGAEEHVLLGGQNLLKQYGPNLIIECHNFLDKMLSTKAKDIILSCNNYEIEEIERDPCVILYAKLKV